MICNQQELKTFKATPIDQRATVIYADLVCFGERVTKALCSPNLKGLHLVVKPAVRTKVIEAFWEEILESRGVELVNFDFDRVVSLPFHKLTLRAPVSTTLRLLQILGDDLGEKFVNLLGCSVRFNCVLEELSVGSLTGFSPKKYSKLLLYLASGNISSVAGFHMDEVSFFCASIMLWHSKVTFVRVGWWKTSKQKRLWRYLLGTAGKSQRNIILDTTACKKLFSMEEWNILFFLLKSQPV